MLSADVINKERAITELTLVIRKIFSEPEICAIAMEIAAKHVHDNNARVLIADELSALTNVKIPVEHSEADKLFLDLLIDMARDATALY
ncbi:MAG: isocitrate dehydrogenase kinase/phosphatase [Oceanospirillaceae bacterium]|jgi:isocitrate dehydrogenase kinase/phosphatase